MEYCLALLLTATKRKLECSSDFSANQGIFLQNGVFALNQAAIWWCPVIAAEMVGISLGKASVKSDRTSLSVSEMLDAQASIGSINEDEAQDMQDMQSLEYRPQSLKIPLNDIINVYAVSFPFNPPILSFNIFYFRAILPLGIITNCLFCFFCSANGQRIRWMMH